MRKNGNGNGHGPRTIRTYLSYNFRDKDPAIDSLRTIVDDAALTYGKIEAETGVSSSTLRHWFLGITKQPRHSTMARVLNGLGFEFVIQKRKEQDDKARAPMIINRFPTAQQVRSRPRARPFKEDRPNA